MSKARLYVLHAVPANMPFSWRASERLELLSTLRKRAERKGVAVRVVEQHGDPARVIVLHANSRKADLVVLGSNRRRGWRRFSEGSVGERVLRRAAWAVLIVPWDTSPGRCAQGTTSQLPKYRQRCCVSNDLATPVRTIVNTPPTPRQAACLERELFCLVGRMNRATSWAEDEARALDESAEVLRRALQSIAS